MVLALLAAAAIACCVALMMGFRQWYVIIGIVLGCVSCLNWVNYYLHCDKAVKSMSAPTVTVRIADDSIEFETSEQNSQYQWSRIKKVWMFRDVWLLFTYSEDTFTLIPAEKLSDESKALIEKEVVAHGGKVS